MKLNPFEIAKTINNALKNKDRYKARIDELKTSPLVGMSGDVKAIYDIDANRISKIDCGGVEIGQLNKIKDAVNDAFDKADAVWAEFEK